MIGRRDFLKLAGGAVGGASVGLLVACRRETNPAGSNGGKSTNRRRVGSAAGQGRLLARPAPRAWDTRMRPGLRPLGIENARDGLLYIPAGYRATGKAPLALTLHGSGGNARRGISHFLDLADEFGLVLLSPESRGRTWDVLVGGYGPDVTFID